MRTSTPGVCLATSIAIGSLGVGSVAMADQPAPAASPAEVGHGVGKGEGYSYEPSFNVGDAYMRVQERSATEAVLQIADKAFVPKGGKPGPVIHLTGAIHIADRPFYEQMQARLDALDVVLFEGVRPKGGSRIPADATDEVRATATSDRLSMLAEIVKARWKATGTPPQSWESIGAEKPKLKSVLDDLAIDGWGRPIQLELITPTPPPAAAGDNPEEAAKPTANTKPRIRIWSTGKGGQTGGSGVEADLEEVVIEPAGKADSKSPNLQEKLAKVFALAYQGEVMDTTKRNWRSSDLSIDQIIARAKAAGGDASFLLSMLDGSSMMARLGSMVLSFVDSSPSLKAMMKMTLIEAMASADLEQQSKALGKANAALMKVIIQDRNEVVLADLEAIIKNEPAVKSVSAFYGAGHMADMERKLVERFDYQPGEVVWVDAVRLEAGAMGLSEKEFSRLRQSVGQSLKGVKKESKRERKPADPDAAK